MEKTIIQDGRPLHAVEWGTDASIGFIVGTSGVTRIEICAEEYIPFACIYKGDHLHARVNLIATNCCIIYCDPQPPAPDGGEEKDE